MITLWKILQNFVDKICVHVFIVLNRIITPKQFHLTVSYFLTLNNSLFQGNV